MAFTYQPMNGMRGKWYCECEKFAVLLASLKAVCDGETENKLNPMHFRAKPATGNFASVVDIF